MMHLLLDWIYHFLTSIDHRPWLLIDRFSVIIPLRQAVWIPRILRDISPERISKLQEGLSRVWRYFFLKQSFDGKMVEQLDAFDGLLQQLSLVANRLPKYIFSTTN
jgi:hypothetical protein